jgi:transposase, IS30 family
VAIVGRPALARDVRVAFWDGVRAGLGAQEAAAAVGASRESARRWMHEAGGVKGNGPRAGSGRFLQRWEREEIAVGLAQRLPYRQIAARLAPGRSASAVCREVGRNSVRGVYRAHLAEGEALRRELARHLRTGRTLRRPRRKEMAGQRGKLAGMVNICDRPAEAAGRAVPGHWEGDMIEGKAGRSQIGTLVERATRYTMLVPLLDGKTAAAFAAAVTGVIAGLPDSLRRSLTWDQGKEMALHAQIAVAADCKVYFCDPHSPWQRPSNENTNGLLRQYFPKGTDLSVHSPQRLRDVADELNGRPRKVLSWKTPAEAMAEFLDSQAA